MSTVTLKNVIVATFVSMALFFGFVFAADAVSAQDTTEACAALQALGEPCGGDAEGTLTGITRTVIDIFSLVVGIVSVIMVIIGGFRYITSAGDPGSVSGAKNTILYAIVGLVIVVFAQTVVAFVLSEVSN